MAIYTKTGDRGTTALVSGTRISKADPRVCAYGDMDELISMLAVLRCSLSEQHQPLLRKIQENLMWASAHVATEKPVDKLKSFSDEEIVALEKEIDRMTAEIPPMRSFVLPGQPREAAECHLARTICRRAERSVIALNDERDEVVRAARYLNRLSDYLFTLARYQHVELNISEDFWLP